MALSTGWVKVVAAIVLLALGWAACGNEAAQPPSPASGAAAAQPSAFPMTVSDSDGRQVTFTTAPQRIVALAPSFVETLFAIGAGPAIVAVDQNADFPPEAAALPKVSGFQPNLEAIAAIKPDLVLASFDPGELRQSLARLGIPALILEDPPSVAGTLLQISLLGQVTGRSAEAQRLVQEMQRHIDAVRQKLAALQQGPRVYHELDPTLFTIGPGSFVGDLYGILKAQNIAAATGRPYPQLSQEAVIEKNPEVIILADEQAGESAVTVAARPGWRSVSAVQTGRVHVVDPDLVSRPGPRLVEGLEMLARLLYPELFR